MNLAALLARRSADREAWRYTDLPALLAELGTSNSPVQQAGWRDLDSRSLPSVVDEPALRLRVAFVDGAFDPDLSHKDDWPTGLRVEAQGDSCSIFVAAETCLATVPLEIIFLRRADTDAGQERNTRLNIALGESSRLSVIEHHLGEAGRTAPHIAEGSVTLAPHAKLSQAVFLHGAPSSACLIRTEAEVGREAYFRHFSMIQGTKLTRQDIHVALRGEQAQAALDGIMLLREREHADTFIKVLHEAPCATSRQFYKSVLQDKAKGAFQGKVVVESAGQFADAQQSCRALLLSDQAEMNAKPELEIYADDVQCSHGCATGNLDDDAMFYLRSRGIAESIARTLLLRAFIDEILDESHAGECAPLARALAERWFTHAD